MISLEKLTEYGITSTIDNISQQLALFYVDEFVESIGIELLATDKKVMAMKKQKEIKKEIITSDGYLKHKKNLARYTSKGDIKAMKLIRELIKLNVLIKYVNVMNFSHAENG